ncbi:MULTISPECIES: lipid IV(A) 3-deoxy-D-manno-octulosonic acid transferase [unclassified Legionella]|uniref:lipid IV(A) 3-deoxy-D-manno-octulosonic acid transferase n=1 Tax=unclassified Legionella TaxID=2622702 RepID=UPI0010559EF0|nr:MULTISPECIES: lipid IV(A) 3-deoxy-D-manno-octulosonic acid transferase [unclassified Legionella]MDI9819085.1 lipid IV(A) 3-deoxy-D-manno-octulosonic acid transferase [Legionella sp. PL877]
MRQAYSLLMYLLVPWLLLRLWWKGKRIPSYRRRISERFALNKVPQDGVDVWIHAVSLGEVIAVTPLINALLGKQRKIMVTTMTPTGSEQVRQRFGSSITHQYVPYDLPWIVKRFYKNIRPRSVVFVETELWPNLIYYAHKAKIPLFLVNARLSERSYQGYKKLKFFFQLMLGQFDAILTQSEDDAKRYQALGAPKEKVQVVGNIKFDLQTQAANPGVFRQLKTRWGSHRTVIIIASTHDNEEELILSGLGTLQAAIPDVLLLIAPRHPERFQQIYQLSRQMKFNTGLRSKIDTLKPDNEVIVLDSLGELLGFYQVSDYAFVGGSLIPVGGHNVLEPIAMEVPVLTGPYIHNFKTICCDLMEAKAIESVRHVNELIERIVSLHQDKERKNSLVRNATLVLEKNKGAVARYAEKIEVALQG